MARPTGLRIPQAYTRRPGRPSGSVLRFRKVASQSEPRADQIQQARGDHGSLNSLRLARANQVQRVDAAAMPNWYGIAASFDDLQFGRDDGVRCDYR